MAKKKTANKSATKKVARKVAAKKAAPKAAARKATPKKAAARRSKRASARRVPAVVHWEIQSQNPERLHRFYAEALGWNVNANNPMNYGMVSSKGKDGIDGGIGGSPHPGSRVLVYASVPNIPEVLARIASLGGDIVMERTDVGPVIMGLYRDPEGHVMGLLEG